MVLTKKLKNKIYKILTFTFLTFIVFSGFCLAQYSEDEKILRQAIAEKDASYCQQLTEMNPEQCLFDMTAALNDDQYCQNITAADLKTQCLEIIIFRQAITAGSLIDCNQITNLELNSQCIKQIISTQTNVDFCNSIEGSDQAFCNDSVAANQAIAKQDIAECDNISDTTTRGNCQTVIKALPQDSDKDGLPDSQERSYGLNPFAADTDADGVDDYQEASQYQTDPRQADTDKDGVNDGLEIVAGSDPLDENITARRPADLAPQPIALLNIFIIAIVVLIISLVVLFLIIKYKQ
jgi:hypothetical protein